MQKHISILEAATILGITTTTLRRWEKSKRFLPSYRTFGNHRRYELSKILKLINPKSCENKKTLLYSRVSSYDQKNDLKRQSDTLLNFAQKKNIKI